MDLNVHLGNVKGVFKLSSMEFEIGAHWEDTDFIM